ncbi:MAG: aldo/keto reductase [Candidatus Dormibacteraeota bacterium]|nr:aldo/keto reductase [Candidatus Dormibacteraeota bacterium]
MRYVVAAGEHVSVIGLGTWQFGSGEWGYGGEYAERTAVEIVNRALDLGINLIDTAEIYGLGRSERIVGRAIAGRREQAFLASKIFPVLPVPFVIRRRARRSARRLQVEQIDLYQLHFPNPLVPASAQLGGLRGLLGQGLIRHAGVSNYSLAAWQRADGALGSPVLSNQVSYSLLQQHPRAELVPFAQREGRLVIAYSPLSQGALSGRYGPERRPSGRIRHLNPLFRRPQRLAVLGAELRAVGERHGATASQVALAWLVNQPQVVAIPGASSVAQLEENAAAGDLRLDTEDIVRLDTASARFHSA